MTAAARGAGGFRRLDERTIHQGYVWRVAVAEFEAPDGERFTRDIVRSPGAVGVVPVLFDSEGVASVVLVHQYRPVLDEWVFEIPAGMRDVPGEEPELTAARELAEEVGFVASHLELLTVFHPSVGMTDSTTHVFLATGLRAVDVERHGPEEQAMQIAHVSLDDAVARARRGELTDAKTVIGVLLAYARLSRADGLG